jgi:hypothetical protein
MVEQVRQRIVDDTEVQVRYAGYGVTMLVNITLLYAAHNVLAWGIPFFAPSFADVLWVIDLSLGAAIVANALFIAYDAEWFRHVTHVGLDGLSLLSTYIIYRVFPFDIDPPWYGVVVLVLLVAMLGTAISLLVHVVQSFGDLVK